MKHKHQDNQCYVNGSLADYRIEGMKRETCFEGKRFDDETEEEGESPSHQAMEWLMLDGQMTYIRWPLVDNCTIPSFWLAL